MSTTRVVQNTKDENSMLFTCLEKRKKEKQVCISACSKRKAFLQTLFAGRCKRKDPGAGAELKLLQTRLLWHETHLNCNS